MKVNLNLLLFYLVFLNVNLAGSVFTAYTDSILPIKSLTKKGAVSHMNLKEIEYIVTIAEEQKLNCAAEKLFVTPSALTQQVANLEREIGAPLFYRSRNGWTPTEAGNIYLTSAREILQIRSETDKRLQDLVNARRGTLTVGITSEHGSSMFTHIYPLFHQDYPEVTINIYENNVRDQQQMLRNGELDLAFLTLSEEQRTDDIYTPLAKEELLLAIPAGHLACQYARKTEKSRYAELDISILHNDPFAMMYKQSTMFRMLAAHFESCGFSPRTLFYTQRSVNALEMVSANICCTVVPAFFAAGAHRSTFDNVAFFSMPSHPVWDITVSCKRGSYLTDAAHAFIKLAKDYWGALKLR